MIHDAALQLVFRNARPLGQQLTAAVGSVAAHHHLVPLALVERLSVRHAQYAHLLSVRLGQVHLVVYARCRVEVEGIILESRALLVVGRCLVQPQCMVVRRRHRVGPHVVAVLQVLANFLTRHAQHEHQVLESVQFEHVGLPHLTRLDFRVEGQWRGQRYLRLRYLQLQRVYQVSECRVAEEAVARIDGIFELAYTLSHKVLHLPDVLVEVCHHLLVYVLVLHVDDVAADRLLRQPALLESQRDVRLGYILHKAARVDAQHLLPLAVGNPFVVHLMVMSEEDDVEAGNVLGHRLSGILLILVSLDAVVQSRVEQADYQVRLLLLLDVFHPFACTGRHFLKLHALPRRSVQPIGYGRCQHADDTYLHAVLHVHRVGAQTVVDALRLGVAALRALLHDVGPQQRTAHLANPLVVHLVARLYVVVAHRLRVITHVVDHPRCQVFVLRHHEVRPIDARLTLQYVAVVNQQQVVAILLTFLTDVAVGPHQRTLQRFTLRKVPRKEVPVHVTGFNHLQPDHLL